MTTATTATKIPVNSIVVPDRFVELCEGWAGNLNCMLRAVESTGGLTTGTYRSGGCDTDEQWYLTIWDDLAFDIYQCHKSVGPDHEDYSALVEFEDWVDKQCDRLRASYGLEDWDRN